LKKLVAKRLDAALRKYAASDLYVYYTGGEYRTRGSTTLRYGCLSQITEVKQPIHVAELIRRAARISGTKGYDPEVVVHGLKMHSGSKPCVYYMLRRQADGSFVTALRMDHPNGMGRSMKAGELVIPASDIRDHPIR
jgi:hypothetical protein